MKAIGQIVTVVPAAELDRTRSRLRVRDAARRIVATGDTLATEGVLLRRSTEILRGYFLQLQPRVGRRSEVRASHRMCRLTADRHAGPRNVLRRAAPADGDPLPRHGED